jgi:hypothetical protein
MKLLNSLFGLKKDLPNKSSIIIKECLNNKGRGLFVNGLKLKKGSIIINNILPTVFVPTTNKNNENLTQNEMDMNELYCIQSYDDIEKEEKDIAIKIMKFSSNPLNNTSSSTYHNLIASLCFRVCYESKIGFQNTLFLMNQLVSADVNSIIKDDRVKLLFQESVIDIKDRLEKESYKEEINKLLFPEKEKSLLLYAKLFSMLSLNTIKTPFGSALYSLPSFLNHSCIPNVGFQYNGVKLSIIALKDLSEDDEIFINYIEEEGENWNFRKQQNYLKFNYGFDCEINCSCGEKINL